MSFRSPLESEPAAAKFRADTFDLAEGIYQYTAVNDCTRMSLLRVIGSGSSEGSSTRKIVAMKKQMQTSFVHHQRFRER